MTKKSNRIKQINQLFIDILDRMKQSREKGFRKELLEILFEDPYSKTEYLVQRLGYFTCDSFKIS